MELTSIEKHRSKGWRLCVNLCTEINDASDSIVDVQSPCNIIYSMCHDNRYILQPFEKERMVVQSNILFISTKALDAHCSLSGIQGSWVRQNWKRTSWKLWHTALVWYNSVALQKNENSSSPTDVQWNKWLYFYFSIYGKCGQHFLFRDVKWTQAIFGLGNDIWEDISKHTRVEANCVRLPHWQGRSSAGFYLGR